MKKLLLILALLSLTASSDTPCDKGSCSDFGQQQGLTNSNSPTFNSTPNMNMAGSNVMIQNNNDAFSRIGEVQCANSSVSFGGYKTDSKSETIPFSYENVSDSWGLQANVTIAFGTSDSNCLEAQELKLTKMKWMSQESNIKMCVDMIESGFVASDQIKKTIPQIALCDHFKKMSLVNPKQYQQAIATLRKENETLKQKPVKKVVKGYKEYRVRFVDYINKCKDGCNGEYSSLRGYLKDIKSNFGKEEFRLYAEPYSNDTRISVYLRNNLLTYSEAEMVRQRFMVAGFAVKVQGVRGTEIY